MKKIYPRDLQFLVVLCDWIDHHGYSPTVREMAKALGLRSPNGIHEKVLRLRKRGLVWFIPGKSRTLRPLVRIEVWR